MKISNDIYYVGVNDNKIDLFEGQYKVPNGISYNSYVIKDDKIAVMDTVDINFGHEWLDKISEVVGQKSPDYLIVQHMEPDHSANIHTFMNTYPNAKIVANSKTFAMIEQFFNDDFSDKKIVVENGGSLSLGKHELTFVFAPMVHWPEVMVTYDSFDKVLFSADGFGKFGVPETDENWEDEARRYFFGIVGKYGQQVANLLKKAASLDIEKICPLHGPVLDENLGYYLDLYDTWSSYTPQEEGVVIAYTSVYGNTKTAVEKLAEKLRSKGAPKVILLDLARTDITYNVSEAFKYNKLVLATTTYNADIFPFMRNFIEYLTERNYQNRTIAFVENGTWAPLAAKIMKEHFEKSKNITFADTVVSIKSSLKKNNIEEIEKLSDELCKDYIAQSGVNVNKNDLTALFNIGYGLYVVTSNDGKRDNGLIVNTVTQITDSPNRIAVTINKKNYSYHVINQTGKMNINCLSVDAPFKVFENFGFQSGRNIDKFADTIPMRSDNGLAFLPRYINSFMSLEVEKYIDFDSHGMFICRVTESRIINDKETMTYSYYQSNVKPKPETSGKKGYVCKICGYVYEGESLPADFVCPLCKHGASDFVQIGKDEN